MSVQLRREAERMQAARAAQGPSAPVLFPSEQHYALSAYDRVPPRMFWNMLTLLEQIYAELLAHIPADARVPDSVLLAQLQGPITARTAWDHPIFEALLEALSTRRPAPGAGGAGGDAPRVSS